MKLRHYAPVLLAPLAAVVLQVVHGGAGTPPPGAPRPAAARTWAAPPDDAAGAHGRPAPSAGIADPPPGVYVGGGDGRRGGTSTPAGEVLDAVGALEAALERGDDWTADRITERLGELAASDRRVAREILRILESLEGGGGTSQPVRNRLARVLFHTGDPSILEALRRVALEGERALARAAPREGPDVLERLDPDKQPARAIADALAGLAPSLLDDPAVRARVRRIALGPGDRSVRRAALQRLAESPGPEETALFERMLEEEPDGPVRLAAMRALSESRAATAAELEIRVLQDPYEQFTLRSFGAIGLGLHAGHPGATRALAEAFWGDPSEAVRRSALRSLITQARTSLDAQRAVARVLAEATDPELRRMAASGLEVGAARGLSRSALEGALVAEACKEVRSECRGVLARMN